MLIPVSKGSIFSRIPVVTIALMAACAWTYFVVQPSDRRAEFETSETAQMRSMTFLTEYAAIPCEVTRNKGLTQAEFDAVYVQRTTLECSQNPEGPRVDPDKYIHLSVVASMFMHGGILHLLGNMIFLWAFGGGLEARLGRLRFLGLYLLAGLVATLGLFASEPNSAVPIVGASGAIAGVMGAYALLFPWAPIRAFVIVTVVELPAVIFLLAWFGAQFYIDPSTQIAWVAHVVGFAFGAIAALWMRSTPETEVLKTQPFPSPKG